MFETFSIYPFPFWVVVGLLIGGGFWAWRRVRDASGLPMLALLGTVAFWYVGDAYYNDYANYHAKIFDEGVLRSAWWQVAWFLVVYLFAAPSVHKWMNARYIPRGSGVVQMFKYGVGQPVFQKQLQQLFRICVLIWLAIIILAVLRVKGEIVYFFFPFWGYKAEPWGRGTLGTGYDSLITVVFYFQMLVTEVFGVVAALSTNRRIRSLALLCCLLSFPYFIFDRTRNSILAVVVPGILSWVFLRLRGSLIKKATVLAILFMLVNAWMGFVIANRDTTSITAALKQKGFTLASDEKIHHEGLNMYEELCWINTFIEQGKYSPNWGARYFADLVNPIPRVLWPGKPMIGFDYAVLRGQEVGGEAGVITATISTGLIGQGVVNFGRFLGPAAAALIMSFWAAVVARMDLRLQEFGRLPLYLIGLFVTYNVGRDFCFLALYPFVFGALAVWFLDQYRARPRSSPRRIGPLRPQPGFGQKSGAGAKLSKASRKTMRRIGLRHPAASLLKRRKPIRPAIR